MVLWQRVEALSKVSDFAQLVLHRASVVFNFLLYDHGLREGLINALLVDRLSNSIEKLLLVVAERMLVWVHSPSVVALFLDAGSDVAVSFLIHGGYCGLFFIRSACWV